MVFRLILQDSLIQSDHRPSRPDGKANDSKNGIGTTTSGNFGNGQGIDRLPNDRAEMEWELRWDCLRYAPAMPVCTQRAGLFTPLQRFPAFEPTEPSGSPVFRTGAIDLSPPRLRLPHSAGSRPAGTRTASGNHTDPPHNQVIASTNRENCPPP